MGSAYTPGLKISSDHVVVKQRKLPIAGEVLAEVGQTVQHDTIVARAELPGDIDTVRLAEKMQLDPDELAGKVRVGIGDSVTRGDLLAESAGLFGWFRSEVKAPATGTVEFITESNGHLGIRRPPTGIEVKAYVGGKIVAVEKNQGVSVQTRGAFVQGIFGVGGERHGEILVIAESRKEVVSSVSGDVEGKILIGGAQVTRSALADAARRGAVGMVAGGILDSELGDFVGHQIGVAITGDEDVPLTLILTEGFGPIHMAERTFKLLKGLEGKFAAINGATQIRAGAMRPEIIVPMTSGQEEGSSPQPEDDNVLAVGTVIRAVRQPHFGRVGSVVELPPEPVRVPSGAVVRVLRVKFEAGDEATVPRSNVEIIGLH